MTPVQYPSASSCWHGRVFGTVTTLLTPVARSMMCASASPGNTGPASSRLGGPGARRPWLCRAGAVPDGNRPRARSGEGSSAQARSLRRRR